MNAQLHRTAASKAVYANPPDYPEMVVWSRYLRPGDLFVDVGANVGTYSLWAADHGARVIALEPAPDTFALLEQNLALNAYSVVAIQAVAGATGGLAGFTTGLDAANRLDPENGHQVRMVTVDEVIGTAHVHGMKIDVEGFEEEVLKGCHMLLSEQRVDLIQIEWNSTSLAARGTDRTPVAGVLSRYGYVLYRPDEYGLLHRTYDVGFGPDVFAASDALSRTIDTS